MNQANNTTVQSTGKDKKERTSPIRQGSVGKDEGYGCQTHALRVEHE